MIYDLLKDKYEKIFPEVLTLGPIKTKGKRSTINVAPGATLGHPSKDFMQLFTGIQDKEEQENLLRSRSPVLISEEAIIGPYSILYEGVRIEENVFLEGRCIIRCHSSIGNGSRIYFGAYIGKNVRINNNCKIGGFICNRALVGNGSAILGSLIHEYSCPNLKKEEPSPKIGTNVLIGMNALIIGDVKVGDNAKVSAGATVLKDVPPSHLVIGVWK